jgi:hypothetical protein
MSSEGVDCMSNLSTPRGSDQDQETWMIGKACTVLCIYSVEMLNFKLAAVAIEHAGRRASNQECRLGLEAPTVGNGGGGQPR